MLFRSSIRDHHAQRIYRTFRLADNILFLSNISEIHVECASHNFTDIIPVQKPQIIFSIQCGCRLIFDTILYYSSVSNCAENQNVSDSLQISYAVNLALNIKCVVHDNLGWKNWTTRYNCRFSAASLALRVIFSVSLGTYSVLSWSPPIVSLLCYVVLSLCYLNAIAWFLLAYKCVMFDLCKFIETYIWVPTSRWI